jgi:hypothetical protein
MKTLPYHFYTMPNVANTTMDKKDLREVLLSTGGFILACGHLYDIKSRHLGVGIYKVWLKLTSEDKIMR